MKLLFDQNLAPRLVRELETLYPNSAHVANLGLERSSDTTVWERAKADSYAIVSKDDDFQQHSAVHGHPPKVVLIRTGNCPTSRILEILRSRHEDLTGFDFDDSASLLILH